MKIASLTDKLEYQEKRPVVQLLMDTDNGKEIRIVFKDGQVMKKHRTPFSIVVEVHEGAIDFGVENDILALKKGDLIALEGNIPHDLTAKKDSIVRLSLNKGDSADRVSKVVNE